MEAPTVMLGSQLSPAVPPPESLKDRSHVAGKLQGWGINAAQGAAYVGSHVDDVLAVNTFISANRNAGLAVQAILSSDAPFWKAFTATRLCSIIRVPFSISNIVTSIREGRASYDREEKVDAVLTTIGGLGDIADAVSTFGNGLQVISDAINVSWVTPLVIASVPLQAAGMLASTIGWYRCFKAHRELNASVAVNGNIRTLHWLATKKDAYLKRNFKVKKGSEVRELLNKALAKVYNADEDCYEKAEGLIKDLKRRVSRQKWSHALSAMATAIGLLALAVLYLSPAAPVGYSMLAIAAILVILNFAFERYHQKQPLFKLDDVTVKAHPKAEGLFQS